ncbi:hypothetical protein AB0L85_21775 [Streptomyces sp. NPDC052051]|uniref:hypothetical protein n=1 Tax=Streptomyces sp. NPDC052051 TaxID=3154649 RepID=UPI003448EBD7
MTDSTWLNCRSHQLTPGNEFFRSDRSFHLLAYSNSHGRLLMRSVGQPDTPGEPETTIDLLFKPAIVVKIRDSYRGLAIRCATEAERARVKAEYTSVSFDSEDQVFVLESQGESDYVVALAVGWTEGILDLTRPSFFTDFRPDSATWPHRPLDGPAHGLDAASPQELIAALTDEETTPKRRTRHGHIYIVMMRATHPTGPEVKGVGAFLTRTEAEEAQAVITAKSVECWVEELPIAV